MMREAFSPGGASAAPGGAAPGAARGAAGGQTPMSADASNVSAIKVAPVSPAAQAPVSDPEHQAGASQRPKYRTAPEQTDVEDVAGRPESPQAQKRRSGARAFVAFSPEAFRAAMVAAGLTPPDHIQADGKKHRFSTNGKGTDDAGEYRVYPDGVPSGYFKDYRTGEYHPWSQGIGRELTKREQQEHRQRQQTMNRERAAAKKKLQKAAAKRARELWDGAEAAPVDHPYLVRKDVPAHELRLYRAEHLGALKLGGMDCDGALIVPFREVSGDLSTLQMIQGDGEKRFLPDGAKKGAFYMIGAAGDVLVIAEGFATGASIHAATGYPVAVAGDAGNLEPVALALRKAHPEVRMAIGADDDYLTPGNPGMTKASKAAQAVHAALVRPVFTEPRPEKATDFNDMHAAEGLEAVRAVFEQALEDQSKAAADATSDVTTPEGRAARVAELATMAPLEFKRIKAAAAAAMGITGGDLESVVREYRKADAARNDGEAVDFEAIVREAFGANREPDMAQRTGPVEFTDFYSYAPGGNYVFIPTRELWPAKSVNAALPKVAVSPGKFMKPARWLDRERLVLQMTWAPGEPQIIRDKLMQQGGWVPHPGGNALNLYQPPMISHGDASKAGPWLDHVRLVYPEDAEHIVCWLAHRVQRPGEKINHALVLGGSQGIGKDTLLEPIKHAVGPWNVQEATPEGVMGRFNGFLKSVVLRVNEARDLGDGARSAFYDRMKNYTAAPPDMLTCDEKNLKEHKIPNVCGVIVTTNYKVGGLYIPPEDRRYFVAWSERTLKDFDEAYWLELYGWYESGGYGHVAAYLAQLDLSGWNPKAPPPRTQAWHEIVGANRAPENAEVADAIVALGNPSALTLYMLTSKATDELATWLKDKRNGRQIPHRLEDAGYTEIPNPDAQSGLWVIQGKRQVIYARKDLSAQERHKAAVALQRGETYTAPPGDSCEAPPGAASARNGAPPHPQLCITPQRCAGLRACPRNPACTE